EGVWQTVCWDHRLLEEDRIVWVTPVAACGRACPARCVPRCARSSCSSACAGCRRRPSRLAGRPAPARWRSLRALRRPAALCSGRGRDRNGGVEPAASGARRTAMTGRSLLMLVAGCLLAAAACATPPGSPDRGGTTSSGPASGGDPSSGPTSGGPTSGGPTSGGPASGEPVGGARQVFFDPQDLSTPDTRAVLRTREDVAAYLRWLRTHPAPGLASPRLVAALAGERLDGEVLVVFARTVGCDSVGRGELTRHGTHLGRAAL